MVPLRARSWEEIHHFHLNEAVSDSVPPPPSSIRRREWRRNQITHTSLQVRHVDISIACLYWATYRYATPRNQPCVYTSSKANRAGRKSSTTSRASSLSADGTSNRWRTTGHLDGFGSYSSYTTAFFFLLLLLPPTTMHLLFVSWMSFGIFRLMAQTVPKVF